ncbi:MAG TPA: hypothetical protein VHN37_14950 [Actinomycetota bacterium]|nr:hypothetical protein [Actinomycetota bacterium]
MRDLTFLASDQNLNYLYAPVPAARDDEIRKFLDTLNNPEDYATLRRAVTWDQTKTLRTFAERAATIAVKRSDVGFLVSGIVALYLAGFDPDEDAEVIATREAALTLPLLLKSARRMQVGIRRLVREVGSAVGHERASALRSFRRWSPLGLTLRAMGYREATDPDSALLYEKISD